MPQPSWQFQPPRERRRPVPEAIDLCVLFEDDHLIVVDKPPGMVVHPTYKNWSGTVLNGLLARAAGRGGGTPSVITRLDKHTSGVVVAAWSADVHAKVQRDAAARRVTKEYLAIVSGRPSPPRGEISLPLRRSPDDRRLVVVADDGQPSQTNYDLCWTDGTRSIVRCELLTGRTHQIRVHLAARGWPIVGDEVYGVPGEGLTRQALHAWRVRLPHPHTAERLEFEAPVPPDLESVLTDDILRSLRCTRA
jgi:23S rRNA pseudouridine1911/1915/1917 synthase